jgi:hypothetical protein
VGPCLLARSLPPGRPPGVPACRRMSSAPPRKGCQSPRAPRCPLTGLPPSPPSAAARRPPAPRPAQPARVPPPARCPPSVKGSARHCEAHPVHVLPVPTTSGQGRRRTCAPPGGPRFPRRVLSQRRVLSAGWSRAVDPLRPVGVRVHHQPVHRPGQAVGPVERTLSLGVGRPARRAKLVRVY